MDCEATRKRIEAWYDGELRPDETLAVAAHVDACAQCRSVADDLRSVSSWLGVEDPAPAPDLEARILATAVRPRRTRWPVRVAAASVGALLMLSAAQLLLPRSSAAPSAADLLVREAVGVSAPSDLPWSDANVLAPLPIEALVEAIRGENG